MSRRRHEPPPKGLHRRLWRAVRHDIGRKLLALMLAILVWLKLSSMVTNDLDHPVLDVIPVKSTKEAREAMQGTPGIYLVVPRDVIVRNDLSAFKVRITGSGLTEEVRDVKLSAVLEVDERVLDGTDEAEWAAGLANRALFESRGPSPEIKDFAVEPDVLRLVLARRAEAEFTLDPLLNVTVDGLPREGYAYDRAGILVHPNRVVLAGPQRAIDALRADPEALKLEPVDVEGAVIEVSQQVGIDTDRVDRSVTLLTNGQVVEVTVPVRPKDVVKELLSVPVVFENEDALLARGQRVAEVTRRIDLKVSGPRSLLDQLGGEKLLGAIRLVFDWRDASLPRASARVRVFRVGMPEGVVRITDRNDRPPEIEYVLEELPAAGASRATDGGDTP